MRSIFRVGVSAGGEIPPPEISSRSSRDFDLPTRGRSNFYFLAASAQSLATSISFGVPWTLLKARTAWSF